MPIFAYQVWYDRSKKRTNGTIILIVATASAVIVSCALCAWANRYDMGFTFIPLLLGSLYGGHAVMALLFAVYAAGKLIHYGHAPWALVELAGFFLILLPVLYGCKPSFAAALRKQRHIIMSLLVSLVIAIKAAAFLIYPIHTATHAHSTISHSTVWHFAIYAVLYYLAAWFGIYMNENFIERLQLQRKVNELSDSNRIEMQKLQQLIDGNPLGVIFVDQNGLITHLNGQAIELFKKDLPEEASLIGASYKKLENREGGKALTRLLAQALNGRPAATEYIQEQAKIYAHTGISVRDNTNGQIVGAAIIVHDMTELTRLRSEVDRMERLSLVGQMAASITHEIRNPMAVIRGFVQLMRERSQESQQEYFRIVIEELDRANSIINDFLSLAQNRMIEKESCSLHDIVQELAPLLWADANLRGIEVQLELSEHMPQLMLNPKEMKQLILNLARNGMEAMEQHGKLRISTTVSPDQVELRINDTGVGIPQEQVDRLFEPFYTTKSSGTGLGLPLCLSIVERHGGKIRVESAEGQGTTFIVTFDRHVNS
nr:ATP-binding protein [Paenibacillus phyllosphaerae]